MLRSVSSFLLSKLAAQLQTHVHCVPKGHLLAHVQRMATFSQPLRSRYEIFIEVASHVPRISGQVVVDEVAHVMQFWSDMVSQDLFVKGTTRQQVQGGSKNQIVPFHVTACFEAHPAPGPQTQAFHRC